MNLKQIHCWRSNFKCSLVKSQNNYKVNLLWLIIIKRFFNYSFLKIIFATFKKYQSKHGNQKWFLQFSKTVFYLLFLKVKFVKINISTVKHLLRVHNILFLNYKSHQVRGVDLYSWWYKMFILKVMYFIKHGWLEIRKMKF